MTTIMTPPVAPSLSATARADLATFFRSAGHAPSSAHWAALDDILVTLERMATTPSYSLFDRKVLLSSCDCGAGKSSAAGMFLRALVQSPTDQHVGAIYCIRTKDEIRTLLDTMVGLGIPKQAVKVLTSEDEVNALGSSADTDQCQVLLTTQQRLEKRCQASFESASEFSYLGKPRAVRIWDESWLGGAAITLNQFDLTALMKPLMHRPKLADALIDLFTRLRAAEDHELVAIPNWGDLGITLHDALASLTSRSHEDQQAITGLFMLSGRMARVRLDGPTGNSMLTYEDTLPEDLLPLLVLDASGRVRQTYADMENHRENVVRLAHAVKDYSPLTVHVWQRSGSKAGWQRHGQELIEGIANTIMTKPHERWLVVHHLPSSRIPDVPAEVLKLLPATLTGQVSWTHWGKHQASNSWADVPNVILAGTLFMRPSLYTALTHLAQGKQSSHHRLPGADIQRTIIGEHKDMLLQSVCRGRVRKLDGDKCLPMSAYIIASPTSGIPGALQDVFPGCRRERWAPIERKLTGKLGLAVEVFEQLAQVGISPITYRDLRAHISLKDVNNWRRAVATRAEWFDAISNYGYAQTTLKGGAQGLVMLPDAAIREQ
jgi:hypothetical protein